MKPTAYTPIRRTKIVATLGPASDREGVLEGMLRAGVDVVRLNFSHGSADDHRRRLVEVREISQRLGRSVAVLADLQGPKIRIARFKDDAVVLGEGQPFVLDMLLDSNAGDITRVGCDYKTLADDVIVGDRLLLDDGRLVLEVSAIKGQEIHTRVVVGGKLSNNKGINKQGGGLSAAALTDKDKRDIKTAIEIGVDYLAVSFPRSAADMQEARKLLGEDGKEIGLVAKIERAEAVADDEILDGIIKASEAVMVARGDLGVEIGDAQLIGVQKRMIKRARSLNRAVITATQMMETMISAPLPTRAEVFDVANAVLDGTDAVMLSAETAAGDFPVETVKAMDRLCLGAERERSAQESGHRIHQDFLQADETVALSAMYAANHLAGVTAIACMTSSGFTAMIASRIHSGLPIIGLAQSEISQRRMALYRGVVSLAFDTTSMKAEELNDKAIELLVSKGIVSQNDHVILTRGNHMNAHGGTNTMKILAVNQSIR
ncbi:pyruvate kinase [Halomonas sp. QX-2]|uniref:Pyruvate kinase n=1 Tax=Vreelandella sedimenti TaxID=2729618 RepID=A0A7Z0SQQ7_9GAMM|nr:MULTISPECIES: pyruvate kinase [Halomonas]NYT75171.1 pyruvate kinase [Halomonas sedimenti]|tara:strand:+ start:15116 stop:16585 length:1470 start_codon:yes stop_codon:yes gene_type:complete